MMRPRGLAVARGRRVVRLAVLSVVAGALVSACSATTPEATRASSTTTTAGTSPAHLVGPVAPSTPSTSTSPGTSTTPTTDISVPLSAIADSGLPSHVGVGPLKAPVLKQLMQFFENEVSQAYSNGDAGSLEHYLAGSMLTGNRGTINVLNAQSQRNIYKINVKSVSLDNNEANRAVFDMKGNMVTDYFENTTTNQQVANGLPGPSTVDFLVFFDYNTKNHTWYWTGEQNLSSTASGASAGTT
jgi:hypothetical protein